MRNFLVFLTQRWLMWLTRPPRFKKEIIIPISREGFLDVCKLIPTFEAEGMAVPGKLLFINFKQGEFVGRLTFKILENNIK